MSFLLFLSEVSIPLLIFYIIIYGLTKKVNVYESFITGAMNGLKTVVKILPTLIGLMIAVGILRGSGFLDFLGSVIGKITNPLGFPAPLVPLVFIRMFSSSAATGLVLDLYKQFGTDSLIGFLASILVSCTETIFYTMSIYFMTAKITKTRYTLAGALISTAAGIIASIFIAAAYCKLPAL